jgi:hypothetical protein
MFGSLTSFEPRKLICYAQMRLHWCISALQCCQNQIAHYKSIERSWLANLRLDSFLVMGAPSHPRGCQAENHEMAAQSLLWSSLSSICNTLNCHRRDTNRGPSFKVQHSTNEVKRHVPLAELVGTWLSFVTHPTMSFWLHACDILCKSLLPHLSL